MVKPEPMRSPKNNITWTEEDEYGDLVEGLTSKKQLKKNLGIKWMMESQESEETVNDMVKKANFNVNSEKSWQRTKPGMHT